MTAHTDGILMEDAELIEMLQRVANEGTPPLRHGIEDLLAKGRHLRRRRQLLMVPASSVAVAGVAALVFAVGHAGTDQPHLVLSPAASGTQESPHPAAQADTNRQVLQEAFGDDFTIGPDGDTGPVPPNVTVRPGSASAEGLPAGVTLWTQLLAGGHGGIPASHLEQFCALMVEKGLHRSACTELVLPGGQVVYEQRGRYSPGEYKAASRGVLLPSDSVRVIYAQPSGQLVIVDLVVVQENESNSSPERRAAVQAWLDRMTSRLATAATDPRVDTTSGCHMTSREACAPPRG